MSGEKGKYGPVPEREPGEWEKAWRRFRKNRPAVGGMYFIFLAVFIALFGYLLAPDHTRDANTQIPELALRPPGTTVSFLPVKLSRETSASSWIAEIFQGKTASERLVPVDPATVALSGDSIQFRYAGRMGQLHLLQVFYSIPDSIFSDSSDYLIKNETGAVTRISKASVREKWTQAPVVFKRHFLLGTDKYGRCMLSRLLLGFRVSLFVGLVAVIISLTIGLIVGLAGGYFGGRLDDLVMLLVNTVWSIPTLLLVFAIVLALGRGIGIIFFAVGLTMWVDVARIVRGQTIALRSLPFVEAVQSMGVGHRRILFRHILPNLLGPVLVVAAGNFATAILVESGLSYLGFGVQPPAPSWGSMLNENYGYALGGKPLLALAPAIAIALTVLAFNLIGNGLRDAIDVKS